MTVTQIFEAVCGIALLCFLLAGCATKQREPIVRTNTIYVPTPVPCSPKLPDVPQYPDTKAAINSAPSLGAMVNLFLAARELRDPYENALRSALAACNGENDAAQ